MITLYSNDQPGGVFICLFRKPHPARPEILLWQRRVAGHRFPLACIQYALQNQRPLRLKTCYRMSHSRRYLDYIPNRKSCSSGMIRLAEQELGRINPEEIPDQPESCGAPLPGIERSNLSHPDPDDGEENELRFRPLALRPRFSGSLPPSWKECMGQASLLCCGDSLTHPPSDS